MAIIKGEEAQAVTPTRLRQIALVAKDVDRARHLLTEVIGTEVVYVDPSVGQWGLVNFLVPLGGDLIEVVSPKQPGTTAGRLISKRGDGGYMIIMQTSDAEVQRKRIEGKRLSKVIYFHEHGDAVCIQYHPRGIKGGMMPELDSHKRTRSNPDPLTSRFSPWHACGNDYASYSAGMKRAFHLHLVGVTLRLAPGDTDTEAAARQWEDVFGVRRNLDGNGSAFSNALMTFAQGEEGKSEGLAEVRIVVEGRKNLERIFGRAKEEGLDCGGTDDGCWVNMIGVTWFFERAEGRTAAGKL